ncbi:MAG: hypothetical protein P8L32_04025 [Paracoccaceae bacterium]|jgi:hypothetical protein|nr:hypothetical protein [Paracoccaceae bacterium]
MSEFWSIIFSPMGIGLYAAFWLFKLTVGVWILRKIVLALPESASNWLRNILRTLGLGNAAASGTSDMK